MSWLTETLNKISNPDKINVNQVLNIPEKFEKPLKLKEISIVNYLNLFK